MCVLVSHAFRNSARKLLGYCPEVVGQGVHPAYDRCIPNFCVLPLFFLNSFSLARFAVYDYSYQYNPEGAEAQVSTRNAGWWGQSTSRDQGPLINLSIFSLFRTSPRSSSCAGARTPPPSRRRCCTPPGDQKHQINPETPSHHHNYLHDHTIISSLKDTIQLFPPSFDTLKRAFVGVHKVFQANDESDVSIGS